MTRIAITAGSTAGSKRRAATEYGPRVIEDKLPTKYVGDKGEEVLEVTFSYDDLPTYGLDEAIYRIPANARIKEATLTVITAFAGGTSYDIGLYQEDGTVIDADGIDAAIALAAINTAGNRVRSDGALVSSFTVDATSVSTTEPPAYTAPTIGAAAGQIVVAATGTFTAGKARLRVVYESSFDRA